MSVAVCFRGYVSACGINVDCAKKARRVAEIRKKPAGVALKAWGCDDDFLSARSAFILDLICSAFL